MFHGYVATDVYPARLLEGQYALVARREGQYMPTCSCVRFSVSVPSAVCSQDQLVVPSRLFLPNATGDLERLQSLCPTVGQS